MKTIKLVGELSNGSHKALLLELPQDMIAGLKIAADGTVDTQTLLKMLMMVQQETELHSEETNLQEHIELMMNIFDESRAIDFDNPAIRQ